MSRPYTIKDPLHRDAALSVMIEKQNGQFYMAVNTIKPTTPTIVNLAVNDDNWHSIAAGLSDLVAWRLSERSGADFYFAFEAAPTEYATAFGWVGDQTSPTLIAVKRRNTAVNNFELLYWKP
jgi:hypothetical protein